MGEPLSRGHTAESGTQAMMDVPSPLQGCFLCPVPPHKGAQVNISWSVLMAVTGRDKMPSWPGWIPGFGPGQGTFTRWYFSFLSPLQFQAGPASNNQVGWSPVSEKLLKCLPEKAERPGALPSGPGTCPILRPGRAGG